MVEVVAPKARVLAEGIGEIHPPRGPVALDVLLVHDGQEHGLCVGLGQGWGLGAVHETVHAQHGRQSHREVKIAGTVLHDGHQEVMQLVGGGQLDVQLKVLLLHDHGILLRHGAPTGGQPGGNR